MSRYETEMINKSQRVLSSGSIIDPIEKLRHLCLARGATGIVGLGRAFRRMDNDGSKQLNQEEFIQGIEETGLELTTEEAIELFKFYISRFDRDGSGSIDVSEFIVTIRPNMSQQREAAVELAYKKLDKGGDGIITIDDLRHVYNVREHPHYKSGVMTEEQILKLFLANFENAEADGKVTREEFFNYYAAISASVDTDGYFDLMMRQAYKL
jgi:Ca2+-binding EF-hand superfamily protein